PRLDDVRLHLIEGLRDDVLPLQLRLRDLLLDENDHRGLVGLFSRHDLLPDSHPDDVGLLHEEPLELFLRSADPVPRHFRSSLIFKFANRGWKGLVINRSSGIYSRGNGGGEGSDSGMLEDISTAFLETIDSNGPIEVALLMRRTGTIMGAWTKGDISREIVSV